MASRELIALNETTPQLLAPQAGDNYLAPRKILVTPEVNTNALAVTGYSLTGSNASSLIDLAGTWNTSGTPTALKLNVTDTASNAASLLLDLQVGSASIAKIDKTGTLTLSGASGIGAKIVSSAQFRTAGIILGYDMDGGSGFAVFDAAFAGAYGGISPYGFVVASAKSIAFGSAGLNTADLFIRRDAANTLAQRNSTTAQTLRVYGTYTDASNYERLALTRAAVTVETAGTGTDDIDLTLTPAGAGVVRFGTHAGVAAELVTGYITIKDAGGTTRKIAVIS